MAAARIWSKAELYELDVPWTIIDGAVYGLGDFLQKHPGGPLILRAVGEDATELFYSHHFQAGTAFTELARLQIGHLGKVPKPPPRPLRRLLNSRLAKAGIRQVAPWPYAESIALGMLVLYACWAYLCFCEGWWKLNIALAWYWWRHLDAGLHAIAHGDFRFSRRLNGVLYSVYWVLCHRAVGYYSGEAGLRGVGLPKHFWHHIFPNDPKRDPDWATMSGIAWVRRHPSADWRPHHLHQCLYWIPTTAVIEPLLELFQVLSSALEATAALLEPPAGDAFAERLRHAAATWGEVVLNPGYQGLAFLSQGVWSALPTLLAARAVARLVLFPFSEVQHYMPEHLEIEEEDEEGEEWAIGQLRRTANLRFENSLLYFLDFLMFHGDSHQIEHHLWPAMSFVQYHKAAKVVRATCAEFEIPYYEIGYGEGYRKIWQQIKQHSVPSALPGVCAAPTSDPSEAPDVPAPGSSLDLPERKRPREQTAEEEPVDVQELPSPPRTRRRRT